MAHLNLDRTRSFFHVIDVIEACFDLYPDRLGIHLMTILVHELDNEQFGR